MRKGWSSFKLGEVVDLKQGFALNKKSHHYLAEDNKGLPLLKISDLINDTETLFVNHSIPQQFIVTPSEIIYSRTGQVGLAFMGKTGVIYNNCFKVIPREKVHSVFLFQWLKNPFVRKTISSLATGSAQPDLNHGAFKSVKINLPPLPTQRKIATILSAYDDLIENNLKRIKLLEEKAQLTYEEWFVRMKFPGHESARFDEETGLPEGWEKKRVRDTTIVVGDGNYSSKYPRSKDFISEGVPFFSTREMNNGRLSIEGVKRISPAQHNTLLKGHLVDGDIILSTRGSIGKVAFVDKAFEGSNINAQLVLFRCDNLSIYNSFLYYQLSNTNSYKMLINVGTGTAQPQLPIKTLHLFEILQPNPVIQQEFHKAVYAQMKIAAALSNQNQLLKEARDILLPRLMMGMIDVDELSGQVVDELAR